MTSTRKLEWALSMNKWLDDTITEFMQLSTAKKLVRAIKNDGVRIRRPESLIQDTADPWDQVIDHPKRMAKVRDKWQPQGEGSRNRMETLAHEYGHILANKQGAPATRKMMRRAELEPRKFNKMPRLYESGKWNEKFAKRHFKSEVEANRAAKRWIAQHGTPQDSKKYSSTSAEALKTYREGWREARRDIDRRRRYRAGELILPE